jgi:hypothetical protein
MPWFLFTVDFSTLPFQTLKYRVQNLIMFPSSPLATELVLPAWLGLMIAASPSGLPLLTPRLIAFPAVGDGACMHQLA